MKSKEKLFCDWVSDQNENASEDLFVLCDFLNLQNPFTAWQPKKIGGIKKKVNS